MRLWREAVVLAIAATICLPSLVQSGNYTCPTTPNMDDGYYWQRTIASMPYPATVSEEVSEGDFPQYHGPVKVREMPLPDKNKNLAHLFPGKYLFFFSPGQQGIAALISHLNSVSSKIVGMAVGTSPGVLQEFLKQSRPAFPVSIAPGSLAVTLGIKTLPALVKIGAGEIFIYEGNIGSEHVGGAE